MVIGSFGLYTDGLAPSMTPPWDGARFPPVDVGLAEAAVADNELANVVDMAPGGQKSAGKSGEESWELEGWGQVDAAGPSRYSYTSRRAWPSILHTAWSPARWFPSKLTTYVDTCLGKPILQQAGLVFCGRPHPLASRLTYRMA